MSKVVTVRRNAMMASQSAAAHNVVIATQNQNGSYWGKTRPNANIAKMAFMTLSCHSTINLAVMHDSILTQRCVRCQQFDKGTRLHLAEQSSSKQAVQEMRQCQSKAF
jgi:hypothetical protein